MNKLLTLFIGAALTACAASPSLEPMEEAPQNSYKRLLRIHSDHSALENHLAAYASSTQDIIVMNTQQFTQFQLILETDSLKTKEEKNPPALLGRLQKHTLPVHFSTNYTLVDEAGKSLKSGNVSVKSVATTKIYPRLTTGKDVPVQTLQQVSEEILQEILPEMSALNWNTTVVEQKDPYHVTIGAGLEAGLQLGHQFESEGQANGLLHIVSFENGRALLRLTHGFLPNIGQKLIPAGKAEGRKSIRRKIESTPQDYGSIPIDFGQNPKDY